jgi:hypothetical protein
MWQQAGIQENHCMLHRAAHDGSQLSICNSPRIRWGHQHIVLATQIWCPCQFNWLQKHVLKNHPCKRKRREHCSAMKPHHSRDLQRAAQSSKKITHWFRWNGRRRLIYPYQNYRSLLCRVWTKNADIIWQARIPLGQMRCWSFHLIWLEILQQQREVNHRPNGNPKEINNDLLDPEEQTEPSIYYLGGRRHPSQHMPSPSRLSHFSESQKLGQLDSEPMNVFVNKFGIKKYLTGGKIAKILRSIAKIVHPGLTAEELNCISLHLGRVWALVLLVKAGMSPAFMTSWLQWMGDSYKLYLWDTSILQHKHVDSLKKESNKVWNYFVATKIYYPTSSQ